MTEFTVGEKLSPMELECILDALGGDAAVAQELRCGVSAISNWKARGIPSGRKFDLLALAGRLGKPITIADVEAAHVAIKVKSTDARGAA